MRLRLLPVLIVTAGVALTARVGDLWQGIGSLALAQTASRAETAAEGQAKRGAPTPSRRTRERETEARAAGVFGNPTSTERGRPRALDLPTDPFSLTEEEIDLLQALAERRRELDLRARELEQREGLLKAAERRIEEKAGGLKALQKSIQDLLVQQEEQTEDQYKSLVKIYENMKPKDAARIFEELDMEVLMPVVERMKERKTAPILAKMNSARAMAITTQLAQRRNPAVEQPEKR